MKATQDAITHHLVDCVTSNRMTQRQKSLPDLILWLCRVVIFVGARLRTRTGLHSLRLACVGHREPPKIWEQYVPPRPRGTKRRHRQIVSSPEDHPTENMDRRKNGLAWPRYTTRTREPYCARFPPACIERSFKSGCQLPFKPTRRTGGVRHALFAGAPHKTLRISATGLD